MPLPIEPLATIEPTAIQLAAARDWREPEAPPPDWESRYDAASVTKSLANRFRPYTEHETYAQRLSRGPTNQQVMRDAHLTDAENVAKRYAVSLEHHPIGTTSWLLAKSLMLNITGHGCVTDLRTGCYAPWPLEPDALMLYLLLGIIKTNTRYQLHDPPLQVRTQRRSDARQRGTTHPRPDFPIGPPWAVELLQHFHVGLANISHWTDRSKRPPVYDIAAWDALL